MNKRILVYLSLVIFVFSACNNQEKTQTDSKPKTKKNTEVMASSTGGEFDVIVVGENIMDNKALKKHIDTLLREAVPALPQVEEIFFPVFMNIKMFNKMNLRNSNVLIVATKKDKNTLALLKENDLIADTKSNLLESNIDVWSRPQQIITVYAENQDELVSFLFEKSSTIISNFDANAKERLSSIIYSKRYVTKQTKILKEDMGVSFKVPTFYNLIIEAKKGSKDSILKKYNIERLSWYRSESNTTNNNILIYKTAYDENILRDINSIFDLKNRVGKLVGSKNPKAYMSIDTTNYYYYVDKVKISGHDALKIRGIWQMENDYLAGPFINYIIADKEKNSIVFIDAFIFAAGQEKKAFYKRLEVVLETLQIH